MLITRGDYRDIYSNTSIKLSYARLFTRCTLIRDYDEGVTGGIQLTGIDIPLPSLKLEHEDQECLAWCGRNQSFGGPMVL